MVIFKNVKVKNKKTGETEIVNPYTPEELEARTLNPKITPQTTQKATGETRPDVLNPKTRAFESSFTPVEQQANKELLAEQNKAAVEKLKMNLKTNTPEALALAEQQNLEQQQLQKMLIGETPTVQERNVQAGKALGAAFAQTIGISQEKIDANILNKETGKAANFLYTIGGKLGALGGKWSLGEQLFSKSNAGNVRELTADANAITSRARLIYADATSRGGDKTEAIEQLRLTEEAVRQRYADAQLALNASPSQIAEGIDFTEEIYSNLVTLQAYRQALERQQITGEKNVALLGTQPVI